MEHRFTTIINEFICEVSLILKIDKTIHIQTVNVVDDCIITFDDLADDQKTFLLKEVQDYISNKASDISISPSINPKDSTKK